jgi:hypothetical protein
MNAKRLAVLVVLSVLAPASLFAGIIQFQIAEAIADPSVGGGGGGHVLWLPGITTVSGASDRWVLESGGIFTWNQGVGAELTGRVRNMNNSALLIDFAFHFTELNPVPAFVEPKKELDADQYGPAPLIDTSTWTFFDFTGTLTGVGGGISGTFNILQMPDDPKVHPFQLGLGANGKNLEFGASAWFTWESAPGTTRVQMRNTKSGRHGDVNIILQRIPVPLPPTLPLVILGAALLALRVTGTRER